jgi:Protein of unknown function (DUF4257)
MLTKILIGAGVGSVMAVLTHAMRHNTIKKPRNTKRTFFPGFLTDMAYGGLTAVAVVIVADPNGMEKIIVTSILGSYAGEGAIAKLEASNQQANIDSVKSNLEKLNETLPAPEIIALSKTIDRN